MPFGTVKVDNLTSSTQTIGVDALAPKASPTFTGDVTINAQGDLRLADSDSSNYVALQSGATVGSNYTIVLPTTVGTTGQILKSTVSGQVATLAWGADSATDNTKLPLDGSGVMTGDLKFEGSTADSFETILTVTDPTGSDKTVTLPNATGTVSLLDNTETLENKTLDAPVITGNGTAVTQTAGNNSTRIATTAFVGTAISGAGHAPLNSPTFTGTPAAPTAATSTNTTQIATTAYVKAQGYQTSAQIATVYAPLNSPDFVTDISLTAQAQCKFLDTSGGEYVGFMAPGTVGSSYTLTLPAAAAGGDDYRLCSNASGTMSWVAPPAGGASIGLCIALG